MDWIHSRRGPGLKHSQTGGALSALSMLPPPPLHLIAIFSIVIFLLSFSHHADYKAELQRNTNFLFFLLPFILIFLVGYLLIVTGGLYYFQSSRARHEPLHQSTAAAAAVAASFPWGVAALVVLLLALLYYQSSFHSKWFGH
ncbi:hypothetical protein Nepgr_004828 [Nepenthes gracilis]|uniref:Transmembrane protein n=1 Tax=Nepenthes gracilis TaxID=150966 RepID=A0AAD3S277_NEPGR|nr:hypothetical protein Nepgr_004828 [Nepenthes gracilis]